MKWIFTVWSAVELVGIVAAMIGSIADASHGDARQTVLAPELTFFAQRVVQCRFAVAFVGSIGTIRRSVTRPADRNATIIRLALEFLLAAGGARKFIVALVTISLPVAHPPFRNAGIIGTMVLSGKTLAFGTCRKNWRVRYSFQA